MKSLFRLPGPTPVPPEVFAAMQREMIPHRSRQFSTFYSDLISRLRDIHRTDGQVLVWPASGSAGWEIGLANLLAQGDPVLSVSGGDFGDRFRAVANKLRFDVRMLDVEWGSAVSVAELIRALEINPDVKAVLITHNETSTGVTNPVPDLARVVRDHGALLLVDAVSSAAGLPLEMDAWGLDFVISGTQKAWMCPPGAAITAVGPRAIAAAATVNPQIAFFDLDTALASARKGQTAATPPLTLLYALDAALGMIESEGIEAVWQRHIALGGQTREGLQKLGLELLVSDESAASGTVTAFKPPEGTTATALVDRLFAEHGVTVATGQGKLADSIVRIGHMGWVDAEDIDVCLSAMAESI